MPGPLTAAGRAVRGQFESMWHAWDRFWFTPVEARSLGLLRLLSGLMLVYTHLVWGLALDEFFGPRGWQDPELVRTIQQESWASSLWWFVPPEWLWPVHCGCLVILALYAAGLWTRVASLLSLVIAISYAHRVPMATFGLDQINILLCLYLTLAPSGDYFSLDSLIRRRSRGGAGAADRSDAQRTVDPAPSTAAGIARRLIQVHIAILYLSAGIAKLKGETWWDGTAIWLGAANFEYQSGSLLWLAWHPRLVDLLTHLTILWELTFIVFVWKPIYRPFVLLGGVLVHLGIGLFLGMWTFGLIMICTYISFLPPELFRRRGETLTAP